MKKGLLSSSPLEMKNPIFAIRFTYVSNGIFLPNNKMSSFVVRFGSRRFPIATYSHYSDYTTELEPSSVPN